MTDTPSMVDAPVEPRDPIRSGMLMAEQRGIPHRMAALGEDEPAIDISTANLRAILEHVVAQARTAAIEEERADRRNDMA